MEFERAIFRVYEKCLEGLREDEPPLSPRSCRLIESLVLFTATALLLALIYLHVTFVGNSSCLPMLLQQFPNPLPSSDQLFNSSTNLTALNLRSDQILRINVKGGLISSNSGSTSQDEEVSILHVGKVSDAVTLRKSQPLFAGNILDSFQSLYHNHPNSTEFPANQVSNAHSSRLHDFDYEFGFSIGLLGSECFGNAFTTALLPLGGIDTVIKNIVQNTFKREGAIIAGTGDYYTWSKQDVDLRSLGFMEKLSFKVTVFFLSIFSFFIVSTVTALLVRILISSGVVLLFPMFYMIQRAGVSAISWRLVSLSYPWVGVPIEILRARHQSAMPFVIAHITRIVVYYSLYEATQFAFSSWFFGELRPGQRELWIFAIMMLLEYYSMIYVRARSSIVLFPRFCFSVYLLLHFYIYSQPSGFHLLAILVMFMFLVWIMIFCVRKYELEAFSRGHVSIDQPRILYNSIPWPVWSVALAPDFTLFWPLDSQSTSIYGNAADTANGPNEPRNVNTNQMSERADDASSVDLLNGTDPELGSSAYASSTPSGDGNRFLRRMTSGAGQYSSVSNSSQHANIN